jgi:glycosyltransferase involved in cell wall biosynthesis
MNGWRNKNARGGDYRTLRVLRNWSNEHRISLILPRLGYEFAKKLLPGLYSIYLSSNEREETESTSAFVLAYLYRSIKSVLFTNEHDQDIIIASSHLLYDILPAIILRKKFKCKLVVYVHHIFHSYRAYEHGMWISVSLLIEKISLFLCKRADLIFVFNDEVKKDLIRKGFETPRILITGNGIEHEFIDSIKMKTHEFDGCYCGSLDKMKGVYDLLDVWEIVLRRSPKSKLVLIGEGPEYEQLLRIIRKKGLEKNILLMGYLPEEQKISTMKSSKLFIFPSYEEGWGISITEAMACGLAVVCYDLEAYHVFGNSIIKIEIANKQAMAKVVSDFLKDKSKLEEAALLAKEATKDMNWDNIASGELKEIIKN